jgi:acyl-CoA thioesterase FadM
MTAGEPFRLRGRVLPEWIDYNEHMMDGYYSVGFADATNACLEALGVGPDYRERTGCTIYTVEAHTFFLQQALVGDELEYETLLLDTDRRRLHLFQTMYMASSREVVATNEIMAVHVDQRIGRVTEMSDDTVAFLTSVAASHAHFGRPKQVGRAISMRPAAGGTS